MHRFFSFVILFRIHQDKMDPLFGGMSTEDLYRMLQLIEMADRNMNVVASDKEISDLNRLLQEADKYDF